VHKIATYKNMCEKGGKEKEKDKCFWLNGPRGNFAQTDRGRARPRGDGVVGTGPHASEREKRTTLGGKRLSDHGGGLAAGGFDGGSSPVVQFSGIRKVGYHGQG
jgi:hypothetical protein